MSPNRDACFAFAAFGPFRLAAIRVLEPSIGEGSQEFLLKIHAETAGPEITGVTDGLPQALFPPRRERDQSHVGEAGGQADREFFNGSLNRRFPRSRTRSIRPWPSRTICSALTV
jgi:hypothetical protein